MHIWRHTLQTEGRHVLTYSPDTDIYNIGQSLITDIPNKNVFVQLNVPHSPTCSYLHLSTLIKALELDPDLSSLPWPKFSKLSVLVILSWTYL